MARKGPRSKPPHLRLIDGTHRPGRHGPRPPEGQAIERPALKCPSHVRGKAREAWAKYITPAVWLDVFREPAAVAFCELWAEFRTAPTGFNAARHAQMRAYMSELGLTEDRARRQQEPTPGGDEFFDT